MSNRHYDQPCKGWKSLDGCKYGEICPRQHVGNGKLKVGSPSTDTALRFRTNICRDFLVDGVCEREWRCTHEHVTQGDLLRRPVPGLETGRPAGGASDTASRGDGDFGAAPRGNDNRGNRSTAAGEPRAAVRRGRSPDEEIATSGARDRRDVAYQVQLPPAQPRGVGSSWRAFGFHGPLYMPPPMMILTGGVPVAFGHGFSPVSMPPPIVVYGH